MRNVGQGTAEQPTQRIKGYFQWLSGKEIIISVVYNILYIFQSWWHPFPHKISSQTLSHCSVLVWAESTVHALVMLLYTHTFNAENGVILVKVKIKPNNAQSCTKIFIHKALFWGNFLSWPVYWSEPAKFKITTNNPNSCNFRHFRTQWFLRSAVMHSTSANFYTDFY